MPRTPRVFLDRAFYHVYGRIARGERIFAEDGEAARFVDILRDVKRRDGLTILAWCVMSSHYHLALRTSTVPLWRSIRLIQWRFARDHNRRRRQLGPVWQGRYQVRMVDEQRYLVQLIAYVHLNPVTAGVVDDPARYRFSGHRELLGKAGDPLVDVDATLALFGTERSQARHEYTRMLRGERDQVWIGEAAQRLPWWRGEGEILAGSVWDEAGAEDVVHDPVRPAGGSAAEYLPRAADAVGIEVQALASRTKAREVVRAREIIAVVGVERYGITAVGLARLLKMSPGSVSRWITRASERRREDEDFAAKCEDLERTLGRE